MVTFHRASIARYFRPLSRKGSPEALVLTVYTFWEPADEETLEAKLKEQYQAGNLGAWKGFYRAEEGEEEAYEYEEVDPSESHGLGLYRWGIVDNKGRSVVKLNPGYWVWATSRNEEVPWRYTRSLPHRPIMGPRYKFGG